MIKNEKRKSFFLITIIYFHLIFVQIAAQNVPVIESLKTSKKDGVINIEFKVSAFTDVAIFIEDNNGTIIRHLAAGVLGNNAPKPFTLNSLSQNLIWDGKADFNKQAPKGQYKVRVATGMGASFEKNISDGAQNNGSVCGMATTQDGKLIVCSGFGGDVANWSGWKIQEYNTDGAYTKTIFPPPENFTKKDLDALGVASVSVDKKDVPVYATIRTRSYLPEVPGRRTSLVTTSKNEILVLLMGTIYALNTDSTAAMSKSRGKRIFNVNGEKNPISFMTLSSDEKYVYISGLPVNKNNFAIYRVKLPERDNPELFFGEDSIKDKDAKHLGGPAQGLATDGKGNLLIADTSNNRVLVIKESDGSLISEFEFQNPNAILVNKKNGNIYISSNKNGDVEIHKLKSIQDTTSLYKKTLKRNGAHEYPYVLVLDNSSETPIVWAGGDYGALFRIIDNGIEFKEKEIEKVKIGHGAFIGMTVDRFCNDKEIYARTDSGVFLRYNEAKNEIGFLKTGTAINEGVTIEVGTNGEIYGAAYPYHILKFDKLGKASPWKSPDPYPEKFKALPHGIYVPVSMTFMTHTIGIRGDGNLFVFQPKSPGNRPPKMLLEYTPDGKMIKKDPIIWKVSDVAVGPKFDNEGNIYIAEQIKPFDQYFPEEFNNLVGKVKIGEKYDSFFNQPQGTVLAMYGSILKFSPKGGTIHWGEENPYEGEPKLDSSLKTIDMSYYHGEMNQRLNGIKQTGAEWAKLGISHIELHYCNCESTRFDVDPFGRVYYPDLLRYQVRVIDTNANEIMHFGSYGNADSQGISYNEKTKSTQVPFAWLIGVGATDKFIYAGDSSNRRLSQIKITYLNEKSELLPE